MAAFSGNVIDAGQRWQPWERDRYGNNVVIVSDEPSSEGYTAIYVHLDRVWVEPGDHVIRGQVIGTVGRTGNAEGQRQAHLHFELRAPFLRLDLVGEDRRVDAFNPYASLVAADPAHLTASNTTATVLGTLSQCQVRSGFLPSLYLGRSSDTYQIPRLEASYERTHYGLTPHGEWRR